MLKIFSNGSFRLFTVFSKESLARIWSSGHSGFLPQFSFSFSHQLGGTDSGSRHNRVGPSDSHGFVIDQPFFRGANADLNLTLAMAMVFFVCWLVWAMQEVGVGFLEGIVRTQGREQGPLKLLMVVVFFAVGLLEVISILFRPVSLSFRLYGNIYAGETMLETMAVWSGFGWLVPIPFYFMELLVGLVQAMVFMLLCAVFTLLICQHEGGTGHRAHG